MKRKGFIKKIIKVTAWVFISSLVTTLLIAANSKKQQHVCKKVAIAIRGIEGSFYIDKSDIQDELKKAANGKLVNKPLEKIDLAQIEKKLEKNLWIADAELYFDSKDVLHVAVTERKPIARVFTIAGNSFYIDTAALRMPLLEKVSIRVPVITNFVNAKKLSSKDSVLLNDVKNLVKFVTVDPFWKAQIAQIDIAADKTFELVPTIGNHIIRIGSAENLDRKFRRLFVFYQKVMSKTGFDKYSMLDVQYEGQVIAVRAGTAAEVDAVQLKKNIEELLRRSKLQQEDEEQMQGDKVNEIKTVAYNEATTKNPIKKVNIEKPITQKSSSLNKTSIQNNPTFEKSLTKNKPIEKKTDRTRDVKKPKAVMPQRH